MRTTEILDRLQKAEFTAVQAREIASILENQKEEQITKEFLESHFKNIDGKFESVDRKFANIEYKFESIDHRFNSARSDLQKEIAQSKYDLVKWIVAGVT